MNKNLEHIVISSLKESLDHVVPHAIVLG